MTVVTDWTLKTAGILVTDLAVVTNRTVRTEGTLTVVTDGTVRTAVTEGTLVTDLTVVTDGTIRTAVTERTLVTDLTVLTWWDSKDSSDRKYIVD